MKLSKVLSIAAVVLLLLIIVNSVGNNNSGSDISNDKLSENKDGQSELNITFYEAVDYECPVCASYHSTVEPLIEAYKDRVVFQIRHNPLRAVHQRAQMAHKAAQAASKQGKFWEMHGRLLDERSSWVTILSETERGPSDSEAQDFIWQIAKDLGLDMSRFEGDFSSRETNDAINADLKWGKSLSDNNKSLSTPSFLLQVGDNQPELIPSKEYSVDCQFHGLGSQCYQKFAEYLDQAIAEASGKKTTETETETEESEEPVNGGEAEEPASPSPTTN